MDKDVREILNVLDQLTSFNLGHIRHIKQTAIRASSSLQLADIPAKGVRKVLKKEQTRVLLSITKAENIFTELRTLYFELLESQKITKEFKEKFKRIEKKQKKEKIFKTYDEVMKEYPLLSS